MTSTTRLAASALITLSIFGSARAEINVLDSVEWLVCSSEVVVVGTVERIDSVQGPHSVVYEDCTVAVERVLKGEVTGERMSFTLRRVGDSPTARPFLESKHEVLFLLSKSANHGSEKRLEGRWVPTTLHRLSLIDLEDPGEVFSKEMRRVDDAKALLALVEKWADSDVRHSLYRDVPYDSPIFRKHYWGSSVLMKVPAEEKYRADFLKLARSDKPGERARGAGQLAKYPGDETVKVLRGLLDDESVRIVSYCSDHVAHMEFYVRSAATSSLRALGEPVPDLALEREPTDAEKRDLREEGRVRWAGSFREALGEGWTIDVADVRTKSIPGPSGDTYPWTQTIVAVNCRRGNDTGTFTLVPRRWPQEDRPTTAYLGIDGPQSQCGRRFHYEGNLPAETIGRVTKYFGLEK